MGTGQQRFHDVSELAAALGSNVVPFVPPHRDEAQPANSQWAEGLALIEQAAAYFTVSEHRANQAEDRAEKVAAKAVEGLRAAQARYEDAEARAQAAERHAAEEIRSAHSRLAEAEAWAQQAEERAREAESRVEAAEARAREAEEGLRRMTEALRQKFSLGGQNHAAAEPPLRRSA